MKKVIFAIAVLTAVTFSACSNNTESTETSNVDSTAVVADTTVVVADSTSEVIDTVATGATGTTGK